MPPVVTIVQEQVLPYRVPFFLELQQRLAHQGVKLVLAYEKGGRCADLDHEPWTVHTRCLRFGSLCWQDFSGIPRETELIVLPQQTRYPHALVQQFANGFRQRKTAFWGHGKVFAPGWESRWGQRLKALLSRHVDWWFAYNQLSASVVEKLGYPPERITAVMNTVDTAALKKRAESLTGEQLAELKASLGIDSENIAVYTGTIYVNKRVDFLLESARIIKRAIPDFHLLMIGDGADEARLKNEAAGDPWIHFLGRMNNEDKVACWLLSKLLLIPGGVGLVVVESLALGLPMVTTSDAVHGPEIDYLRHGENGWCVTGGDSAEAYAAEVISLMLDEPRRNRLSRNALEDGKQYTVACMAANFTKGVMAALGSEKYRRTGIR
jgi:glycosyltransferase involved in cell wall biosynthesis